MKGSVLIAIFLCSIVHGQTTTTNPSTQPDDITQPTLITLKLDGVKGEDALAQLSRASGYELRPYNDAVWKQGKLGDVTVAIDKQPFWAAMKAISLQAGVSIYNSGHNESKIVLLPSNMGGQNFMRLPSSIQGPFLSTVSGIQRTNTIEYANPAGVQRNLQMQLQLFVEPKLRMLQVGYTPEIEEAVDENGNSLLPAGTKGTSRRLSDGYQTGRGIMWSATVGLQYPATNPGATIARMRGKVRALIQVASQSMEIADPLRAKETSQTTAGRRMTFKGLKKIGDRQYQADLLAIRETMEPQQFAELMRNPAVRLVDDQGRSYSSAGGGASSNGNEYTRQMMFYRNPRPGDGQVPGEPAKLVWEWPTETKEISIPFEFTDLPLP